MGRLRPEASAAAPASSAICETCSLNLTREHGWTSTMAVFHCEGQFKSGAPHHHHAPTWGNCWRCRNPLGCVRCAAHAIAEAFCRRCGVWGTKEALVAQGPLGGQTIEDYPAGWHHEYFAARAFRDRGAV
jgi:hypothetical protein